MEHKKTETENKKDPMADLVKAYQADTELQAKINADHMSIRDRLMSRTKTLTIDVPFTDEHGDFNVKCRIFTQHEQDASLEVLGTFEKINKDVKDPKKQVAAYKTELNKVYALLAYPNGICLDSEMTLEFWQSGAFTMDVPFYILRHCMSGMAVAIQNAKSFRKQ
jgi:hypothetical protein